MSERFPAAVMRATPVVPSLASAPGVWTMEQQLQAQAQGIWPVNPELADPYFDYVSLLLHGDGTNGAQNNTFLNTPPTGVGAYAGYFDGSGDYLSVADNAAFEMGSGNYTVELWFYALANTDGGLVFKGQYQNGATWLPGFGIRRMSATLLRFTFNTTGAVGTEKNYDYTATTNINTWYHLAMTVSGGTGYAFLNGVLLNSGGLASIGAISDSAFGVSVGMFPFTNGNIYFNGYISNLRIVKGTALYTSSFTPPTAPLTAVSGTSLLTCQSSTFVDNSSNAFAITVTGNTTVVNPNTVPAITRNGNTTQGSFSPYGTLWSNYFDGTGDYLIPAANGAFALGTGDFTIEGWFFGASASATQGILGCGPNAAGTWNVFVNFPSNAGKVTFNIYGGTAYNSASTFLVNTWNHFAIVRSGGTIKVYLNGVGNTGVSNTNNLTVTNLVIGRSYYNLSQEHFQGNVSNIRIVKSAVYSADFTPPASPLTAISDTVLLTCQSNRFVDNSATGAAITRNGDVAVSRFSPFSPTTAYDTSVIGGSAYFNGSTSYLTLPTTGNPLDWGSSADYTIEAWVYPTSFVGQAGILSRRSPTAASTDWTFYYTSTALVLYGYGLGTITATSTLTLNTWNHVAMCISAGTCRLFINGVLVSTPTAFGASSTNQSSTYVVGHQGSSANTIAGYVSNLRVVKGTALYTSSFTPPAAPLSAIANTAILLSMTNGAIFDNAMQTDLETVGNAQISTSIKKFGTGSLAFDGSGDYLNAGSNSAFVYGTGAYTVEFWVYPNSLSTVHIYTRNSTTGGHQVYWDTTSGLSVASVGSSPFLTAGNTSLVTGQWQHVAVCRNSTATNDTRIFVNGVLKATGTDTTNWAIAGPLCIGADSSGTNAFNGYIDELRITKGYARYTANFTPPAAPFNNQ